MKPARPLRSVLAISTLALMASAAMSTSGCGFLKSLVGANTISLENAEVKAMSVDIRKEQKTICPREAVQMAVFADVVLEDEKEAKSFQTWQGRGSVNKNDTIDFTEFAFHSKQGTFDEDGWFNPNRDLLATVSSEFELTTAYKRRPDKFTFKTTYKPDYGCIRDGGQSGEPGRSGNSGNAGSAGRDGSSGSATASGGDGTDGGPGGPGGSGADGGDGPSLKVWATMASTPFYEKLVAVRIEGASNDLLLFPPEQTLIIIGRGGPGGEGGSGGPGGQGGRGGSGNGGGNGGSGGPGGNGGNGGNGGRGGSVELIFDARFPELERLVTIDVAGGEGGPAGSSGSSGRGGGGGSGQGGGTMGQSGSDGPSGSQGSSGQSGAPGSARAAAGDVAAQFSELAGITPL